MNGYLLAVLSSIFFSLYVIPRKLSKLPASLFSMVMSSGFFSGTVIIYSIFPALHSAEKISPVLWWSILAGGIWAIAFVSFVKSIDYLGLARSNQWKNLQGPVGVLLALSVLGESAYANPILTTVAAVCVFLSALFFTISNGNENRAVEKSGVYLALASAVGFGTVAAIQKYVTLNSGIYIQQIVWSGSIVLSLIFFNFYTKSIRLLKSSSGRDLILAFIAGIFYLGASYLQLFSYKSIAASIGFTIIQMNALWTILIGIFAFREIDIKLHWKRVITGLLFTLAGIYLLALAR